MHVEDYLDLEYTFHGRAGVLRSIGVNVMGQGVMPSKARPRYASNWNAEVVLVLVRHRSCDAYTEGRSLDQPYGPQPRCYANLGGKPRAQLITPLSGPHRRIRDHSQHQDTLV